MITNNTATVQPGLFCTDRQAFNRHLIEGLMALPEAYSLVPINVGDKGEPTKAPKTKGWETKQFDRRDITDGIVKGRFSGVGIKLGEPSGGIVALDVDGLVAKKALADILGEDSLPKTVAFSSGKPGCAQYLFKVPQAKQDGLKPKKEGFANTSTNKKEDLDFRWTGNQSVLPPSAHPETPCYFWVDGCSPDDVEIAELPEKLLNFWLTLINPVKVVTPTTRKDATTYTTHSSEHNTLDGTLKVLGIYPIPIEKLLANSNKKRGKGVSEGGRDDAGIAYAKDILGVQDKEFLLVPFNGGYYRLNIAQNAAVLFNTFCDGCNPPLEDSDRVRIWKSANSKDNSPSIQSEGTLIDLGILHLKQILGIGASSGSDAGKKDIRDLDESIRSMGEPVRLNQMTGKVEVGDKPLDLNQLRRFTMNKFGYTLSTEDCAQCWVGAGQENSYHPVVDYIKALPDTTPLLDLSTLASTLWGNDSEIAAIMLKRKLIGAVARVIQPGCKEDSLLVLTGAQGACKSTFIEALASSEWFTSDLSDITNKDHLRLLVENWLLEMGEVDDILSTKSNEAMKKFTASKKDTYRPAYGRENVTAPRSSSLWATTNKTELLNDPTGDRRYWVVEVKQRIDIDRVHAIRDSIWYSAYQAYLAGEQWYLTDEEEAMRQEAAKQFKEVDIWAETIELGVVCLPLPQGGWVTTYQKVLEHLGVHGVAQNRQSKKRVSAVLTSLGFEYKQVKVSGVNNKYWYIGDKT
jgi:predicted P-loop ATPase